MQIRMQCFVPGCPPTPAAGRAESPSFNYRRNYWIAGDPAATALDEAKADAILATVATTFAYPRLTGAARRQATIKLGLLRCVVRLRGMPMLRWAVRRIPLGWQSRVKTWLRGSV
jgi:hypothetical protein